MIDKKWRNKIQNYTYDNDRIIIVRFMIDSYEYGSPVKERRGCGNIKELMKSGRLKGQEFITTEDRLVEQNMDLNTSIKYRYGEPYMTSKF